MLMDDEAEKGVHNSIDMQDERFIKFYSLGKKAVFYLLLILSASLLVATISSRSNEVSSHNSGIPMVEKIADRKLSAYHSNHFPLPNNKR